jgi:hypothetical protein
VLQRLGQHIERERVEDPYHAQSMLRVLEWMLAKDRPLALSHGERVT